MASIEDLKNNNVSVSIDGAYKDPDDKTAPKKVVGAKTVISNEKAMSKIQPSVYDQKGKIVKAHDKSQEVEEFDENSVINVSVNGIPTIPFEETAQSEDQEELVEDIRSDIEEDEFDVDEEELDEDWGDDEEIDDESDLVDEQEEEEVIEEEDEIEEAPEEVSESPKKKKKVVSITADDLDLEEDHVSGEYATVEEEEADPDDETAVDSEDVTEEDVEDEDETLKKLRDLVSQKMNTAAKKIDLTSFSIAKKPRVNIKNLDRSQDLNVSKWVAWDKKSSFYIKQYLGAELELLRQITMELRNTSGSNAYQLVMRRYSIIYDHIVSPKPPTVEAWLATTTVNDIDDYFFGSYISAFKDSNFMPVDCENNNCKETWLSDDIPVMSMVKFPNEEVKDEFTNIYHNDPLGDTKGIFTTEVVPISQHIAIGFKQSAIYDEIQKLLLDQDFADKFIMTIDAMPYIDCLYNINYETKELEPIGYKEYPGNATKTYKSKVRKYHTVLSTLTSDEFNIINSYRNEITRMDTTKRPSYVVPEFTCPKCGHVKPEEETSAESMVFIRCQLAALMNTSIN